MNVADIDKFLLQRCTISEYMPDHVQFYAKDSWVKIDQSVMLTEEENNKIHDVQYGVMIAKPWERTQLIEETVF